MGHTDEEEEAGVRSGKWEAEVKVSLVSEDPSDEDAVPEWLFSVSLMPGLLKLLCRKSEFLELKAQLGHRAFF